MKKLIASLTAAALVCAVALTGCQSPQPAASGSAASGGAASGDAASEGSSKAPSKTEVSGNLDVWSWNFECGNFGGETETTKLLTKYQDYFKKFYPNVKPTFTYVAYTDYFTKLKVSFSAGQGPDVIGMQVGAPLSQFKPFLKPLAAYAKRDWGENWRDNFVKGSFLQVDKLGDECYALPACLTYAGTMFYSNKLLGQFGMKAPATWEELESTAKTLRSKGALPVVAGAKDDWTNEDAFMTLAADFGGDKVYDAIEGKAKWTDPSIQKAFAYFQKLFTDKIYQDGALGVNMYNDAYSLWNDSKGDCKAPMQINGSWEMGAFSSGSQNYKTYASYDRDVELLPNPAGGEGKVLVTPDAVWSMTTVTKNPEAAWAFIRWSEAEEGMQAMADGFAGFPAWKSIQPKTEMSPELKNIYTKYEKWAESNVAGYRQIPYADLLKAIDDNLQLLATSAETPQQACEAVEKASQAQKR